MTVCIAIRTLFAVVYAEVALSLLRKKYMFILFDLPTHLLK